MKFLTHFVILFTFTSLVKAQDRSIIGDYWLGVNNSYATFEGGTMNTFGIEGNLAVHQNISIGLGMEFGNADYDNGLEADGLGGTFLLLVHNKFESTSDISVDPYVSLSSGFTSLEVNQLNLKINTIPIELEVGSEFIFSDFFALTPYFSIIGYIYEDGADLDTEFQYGLNGDFLISDHFSIGLGLLGNSESTFIFNIRSRVHF